MPRSRSVTTITCQNPACRFFLIEEGKYLTKNGKNSAGNQQYFCYHCQNYFAETKNTPSIIPGLIGARLSAFVGMPRRRSRYAALRA